MIHVSNHPTATTDAAGKTGSRTCFGEGNTTPATSTTASHSRPGTQGPSSSTLSALPDANDSDPAAVDRNSSHEHSPLLLSCPTPNLREDTLGDDHDLFQLHHDFLGAGPDGSGDGDQSFDIDDPSNFANYNLPLQQQQEDNHDEGGYKEHHDAAFIDVMTMATPRIRAVSADDVNPPPFRPLEMDILDSVNNIGSPQGYSSYPQASSSSSRHFGSHTRQRRSAGAPSVSSTTTPTSSTNSSNLPDNHSRWQQQQQQIQQQQDHQYHGIRASLDSGMATLRRWIRSHSGSSTPATAPVAASTNAPTAPRTPIRNSVQWQTTTATTATDASVTDRSLGEEDLFAWTQPGQYPRSHEFFYPTTIREDSVGDHQHFFSNSNQLDPGNRLMQEQNDTRRGRTQSEPNVMRLRDYFFFPSTSSPAPSSARSMRRRRGRHRAYTETHSASSARAGQPHSQLPSITLTPRQLSSSAAAVLYTSSGASTSSAALNNSINQRLARQDDPTNLVSSTQSPPSVTNSNLLGASVRTDGFVTDAGTVFSPDTIGGPPVESIVSDHVGNNAGVTSSSSSTSSFRTPQRGETAVTAAMDLADGNSGGESRRGSGGRRRTPRPTAESLQVDPEREARMRWMRINRRFQLVITIVAILFSFLLFAILICWVALTSTYVVSFEKTCDVPLKAYFWLVTLQLVLDVFRSDILRCIFRWDSNARDPIPCRVILYNIAYLIYALLVLRLGIRSVFVEPSTCKETAPQLFNASTAFVSLSIAAWATIVCGYVLPLCIVAALLTYNGYNPSASAMEGGEGNATQAVFPAAYSTTGAPPWCIDEMQTVRMSDFSDDFPRECCICMEDFHPDDIMVKTACNHVFHKPCCREWLRQARTCPVCRSDIPSTLESLANGANEGDTATRARADSNSRIPVGLTGRPVVGLLRILQRADGEGSFVGSSTGNSRHRSATMRAGQEDGSHGNSNPRTPGPRQQAANVDLESGLGSERQL